MQFQYYQNIIDIPNITIEKNKFPDPTPVLNPQ